MVVVGAEREHGTYGGIFTYQDTVSLNVLFRADISEDGEETYNLEAYDVNDHTGDDFSTFKIDEDGLYVVSHYIIPKCDKIQHVDNLAQTMSVYGYNGEDVMKYTNGEWEKVGINDFVGLNILDSFTVAFCQDYLFSICGLKECFFNINKQLLSKFCGIEKCQTAKHKDLVYKRDLLWMGINTIDYLLDEDRYFEALDMLKSFIDCSGFCNNNDGHGSDGCGCRA